MSAIDQASREAAFRFRELIEMDSRRILIEPRRHLVLGFFDRDAVDMVDFFTDLVVGKAIVAASKSEVVSLDVDGWTRVAQYVRQQRLHDPWHMRGGRGCGFIALVHHDPAY